MYAMNIQNDVIGLVLRENCKSKQVIDFIAWPDVTVGYANFSFVVQQIGHKFKIQKVDKMEEKRQRNSYLSFRVT